MGIRCPTAGGLISGCPPAPTAPTGAAPHQCAGPSGRRRASELAVARWRGRQTRLEPCRRGYQSKRGAEPPLGPGRGDRDGCWGWDPPGQHDGGAVGEVAGPGAVAEALQREAKADEARTDGETELEQEAEQEVVLGLREGGSLSLWRPPLGHMDSTRSSATGQVGAIRSGDLSQLSEPCLQPTVQRMAMPDP